MYFIELLKLQICFVLKRKELLKMVYSGYEISCQSLWKEGRWAPEWNISHGISILAELSKASWPPSVPAFPPATSSSHWIPCLLTNGPVLLPMEFSFLCHLGEAWQEMKGFVFLLHANSSHRSKWKVQCPTWTLLITKNTPLKTFI